MEITQKELDHKLNEAYKKGYNLGLKHALFPGNHKKAILIYNLIKALEELLDFRDEKI